MCNQLATNYQLAMMHHFSKRFISIILIIIVVSIITPNFSSIQPIMFICCTFIQCNKLAISYFIGSSGWLSSKGNINVIATITYMNPVMKCLPMSLCKVLLDEYAINC
jgi:hypothetical protein